MNERMLEIFENIKSCYSSTEQGAWKDGFLEGYQAAQAQQDSCNFRGMDCEYLDSSENKWIPAKFLTLSFGGSEPLVQAMWIGYQAGVESQTQSSTWLEQQSDRYKNGWKHECSVLFYDVELNTRRCSHCGKPAPRKKNHE